MNNITNKKIALIGGAGFIGHNLALALKARGANVSIIDSLQVNNILSFTSLKTENHQLYWNMLKGLTSFLIYSNQKTG